MTIKAITRDDLRKAAEGMWILGDEEGVGGRIDREALDTIWDFLPSEAAAPYRKALERLEAHMVKELTRLRAIPVPTSTNLRKQEYLNDLLALIPADLLRREVGNG